MAKANDKSKAAEFVKQSKNKSTKKRAKTIVTKCEKCNKPFSYSPELKGTEDEPKLCKACIEEKNRIVYRGVCKDCGNSFYVRASEADFLKSKGLNMPKRCYPCRQLKKERKVKELSGEIT